MRTQQDRIGQIRAWFNLPGDDEPVGTTASVGGDGASAQPDLAALLPPAGRISLITGPSGAGKTTLLRAVRAFNRTKQPRRRWIDVSAIRLPNRAVVNCLLPLQLQQTLATLSQVGLAEAALLVRHAARLSDGQQFRLRLALGLCVARRSRRPCVLACDEFAGSLDEVTAGAVAHALRRVVSASDQTSLIVATGREQLLRPLQPDVIARCDFGVVEITTGTSSPR